MTADEIMEQLRPLGTEGYKKIMRNHGVREPFFGVKIEELKKFQKLIKKDYRLALDLYATGNYDAQYLAALIADETRMTREDLGRWLAQANCPAITSTAVAWTASEGPHGYELAREWIESTDEDIAATGWTTLSSVVSVKPDAELDIAALEQLLERVETTIQRQPNRVRYAMNNFVIAVGSYVSSLTERALAAGAEMGKITVDMGNTACQVPGAVAYIKKVQDRGTIGKKRKMARC